MLDEPVEFEVAEGIDNVEVGGGYAEVTEDFGRARMDGEDDWQAVGAVDNCLNSCAQTFGFVNVGRTMKGQNDVFSIFETEFVGAGRFLQAR